MSRAEIGWPGVAHVYHYAGAELRIVAESRHLFQFQGCGKTSVVDPK